MLAAESAVRLSGENATVSILNADSHGRLYLGLSAPLASAITLHRAVFAWPWMVPMLKSRNVRSALAGTTS